jgi:hypothetical protein
LCVRFAIYRATECGQCRISGDDFWENSTGHLGFVPKLVCPGILIDRPSGTSWGEEHRGYIPVLAKGSDARSLARRKLREGVSTWRNYGFLPTCLFHRRRVFARADEWHCPTCATSGFSASLRTVGTGFDGSNARPGRCVNDGQKERQLLSPKWPSI